MRYLSIVLEKMESRKQVNLKNYGEKHMTISNPNVLAYNYVNGGSS